LFLVAVELVAIDLQTVCLLLDLEVFKYTQANRKCGGVLETGGVSRDNLYGFFEAQ
jgi:hypothetical protein